MGYQLITSHSQRFKRWQSIKAYAIINSLEVVFWFVVVGLTLQGITRICQGTSCVFSWLVVVFSFAMVYVQEMSMRTLEANLTSGLHASKRQ
jgi:hypothetical protein